MEYREIEAREIFDAHPIRAFTEHWSTISRGKPTAAWDDFDPFDHPEILPWVLLLKQERRDDPYSLRYAICGDGCRQTFGFSYQGKLFGDNLPPSAIAQRKAEFDRVRAGSGPIYSITSLPIADRDFIEVFRAVFGFRSEQETIDRIMVLLAPTNIALRPALPAKPTAAKPAADQGAQPTAGARALGSNRR